MTVINKFSPKFSCPKCGCDRCSIRLDSMAAKGEDFQRRKRLEWPSGELMVQSCDICGFVQISRPLDYQEPE